MCFYLSRKPGNDKIKGCSIQNLLTEDNKKKIKTNIPGLQLFFNHLPSFLSSYITLESDTVLESFYGNQINS